MRVRTGTLIRNGRPPYRNNVDRRASAREPTEYTSQKRIMYRVDICFIFVGFGEEKVPRVGVECFQLKKHFETTIIIDTK